jgi:hypothetical protein
LKAFFRSQEVISFFCPFFPFLFSFFQGHKIAIFTNQGGVSKGKTVLRDIQAKIDALQALLQVPLVAFIMTEVCNHK